ncbi:MAG TPA: hypothetical protein PLI83_07505, partial [Thermomonas sp.]|nr:hypothetical protein [Thermomonas sp.]
MIEGDANPGTRGSPESSAIAGSPGSQARLGHDALVQRHPIKTAVRGLAKALMPGCGSLHRPCAATEWPVHTRV